MGEAEEILQHHGVRPTAVCLMIYRTMLGFENTFSLADIEDTLDTVDKSTIFRTLTLFAEHHLLHEIEDGSGAKKYCVCRHGESCGPEEMHCHFYCESCHKTFCLDHTHIPAVKYPEGYELHSIEYLMKGICPECQRTLKGEYKVRPTHEC